MFLIRLGSFHQPHLFRLRGEMVDGVIEARSRPMGLCDACNLCYVVREMRWSMAGLVGEEAWDQHFNLRIGVGVTGGRREEGKKGKWAVMRLVCSLYSFLFYVSVVYVRSKRQTKPSRSKSSILVPESSDLLSVIVERGEEKEKQKFSLVGSVRLLAGTRMKNDQHHPCSTWRTRTRT